MFTPLPSEIDTFPLDTRKYKYVQLENGLKVLVISDSAASKSWCTMSVNAGSMHDSLYNIEGLAHFTEHLAFLGSKKYPNDNDFFAAVNKAGGSSNAFTSLDRTTFYFSSSHPEFPNVLDIFAHFFIDPNFNETLISRELKAVDSEHSNNTISDFRRGFRLFKMHALASHPFSSFATGSAETLRDIPNKNGIDVPQIVKTFFKTYYVPQNMKLVVFTKSDFDSIIEPIAKSFSDIPSAPTPQTHDFSNPFDQKSFCKTLKIIPVKKSDKLIIYFKVPPYYQVYKTLISEFFNDILSSEVEGSYFDYLQTNQLATSLVGGETRYSEAFNHLQVSITLTDKGFDNIPEIIGGLFHFVDFFRQNLPLNAKEINPKILELFDEFLLRQNMRFRFRDKPPAINLVLGLASHLHQYPLKEYFTSGSKYLGKDSTTLTLKDQNELAEIIHHSITHENAMYVISSQKFDKQNDCPLVEKWYQFSYSISDGISFEILKKHPNWSTMCLPKLNPFIPSKFAIKHKFVEPKPISQLEFRKVDNFHLPVKEYPYPFPQLISADEKNEFWFSPDTSFGVPKGYIKVQFDFGNRYSKSQKILFSLLSSMFNIKINSLIYVASLAGLHCTINSSSNLLTLTVSGYDEKLAAFLIRILKMFFTFDVSQHEFSMTLEKIKRGLVNIRKSSAFVQARRLKSLLLSDSMDTLETVIDIVDSLSLPQFNYFIKNDLYQYVKTTVYVAGNFTLSEAQAINTSVTESVFNADKSFYTHLTKPLPFEFSSNSQTTKLSTQVIPVVHVRNTNPEEKNNGIVVLHQIGTYYPSVAQVPGLVHTPKFLNPDAITFQQYVMSHLITDILSEKSFVQLRTRESFGYRVHFNLDNASRCLGFEYIIQSNTRTTRETSHRIQSFCIQAHKYLKNMKSSEFEKHIKAAESRSYSRNIRFNGVYGSFARSILNKSYSFDKAHRFAAMLKTITQSMVSDWFYSKCVNPVTSRTAIFRVWNELAEQSEDATTTTNPITTENGDENPQDDLSKDIPKVPDRPIVELKSKNDILLFRNGLPKYGYRFDPPVQWGTYSKDVETLEDNLEDENSKTKKTSESSSTSTSSST